MFGACHSVYDSAKMLEEAKVDDLGKYIKLQYQLQINIVTPLILPFSEKKIDNFLAFYRASFPTATITPKMHMLEDHVVPFLRKWRVGFGFHGEQGAESLHAAFNRITRSYTSIPDRLTRLKCVMREHHLQISPAMVAQEPAVKKRKKL